MKHPKSRKKVRRRGKKKQEIPEARQMNWEFIPQGDLDSWDRTVRYDTRFVFEIRGGNEGAVIICYLMNGDGTPNKVVCEMSGRFNAMPRHEYP
jgi:hypothetical protein